MNNFLQNEKSIEITVRDCYFKNIIKPSAILSYCQDIATEHANELGVGRKDLSEKNLFWVVSKMSVKILRRIRYLEKYKIITYPLNPGRAEAVREYFFYNENNEPVIAASSVWCVLDVHTHTIKRCNTLFDKYSADRFMSDMDIIKSAPATSKITMPDINECTKHDFTVQLTDLDENMHMNNSVYGDLMLNSFDCDKLNKYEMTGFDINFMEELKIGSKVYIYCKDSDEYSVMEARTTSDSGIEKTAFRASVSWKPIINE